MTILDLIQLRAAIENATLVLSSIPDSVVGPDHPIYGELRSAQKMLDQLVQPLGHLYRGKFVLNTEGGPEAWCDRKAYSGPVFAAKCVPE